MVLFETPVEGVSPKAAEPQPHITALTFRQAEPVIMPVMCWPLEQRGGVLAILDCCETVPRN